MESSILKNARLNSLSRRMGRSTRYEDWLRLALDHDELSGREQWKTKEDCSLYDSAEIRIRYNNLSRLLEEGDNTGLLYALNEGVHGNMGGMGRPILYDQAKVGTKQLINDYVEIIVKSLRVIADSSDKDIPFAEKLDFFRRASHCYGRSALMMSGGAGLIYFHHGMVQTLIDNDALPNIISGASAGSWISAQLGTKTDEELKAGHFTHYRYDLPRGENPLMILTGMSDRYTALSIKEMAIEGIANDMTFQEAFEHTGRYINISIAPTEKHQTSRLMNAITSPNVYVRSAIDASASVPGVVPPVTLYAKGANGKPKPYLPSRKWYDGSFADDLPAKRLARLFGVNHYIVSLINPIALPFVSDPKLRRSKGLSKVASGLLINAVKELMLRTEDTISRYGSSFATPAILLSHAVLDQEYTGDINIILRKKDFYWRNALFSYIRDAEVDDLIMAGRRNTWSKLAMIKNSTAISKTLDDILEKLDQGELDQLSLPHKRHLTTVM